MSEQTLAEQTNEGSLEQVALGLNAVDSGINDAIELGSLAGSNSWKTTWHSMQLYFDYSGIQTLKKADQSKYDFLTRMLMPMVRDYVLQLIKVQEVGVMVPQGDACAGAAISKKLRAKNVKTDLLVVVTAEGAASDAWVSWSAACQINSVTGRPTMIRLNVNPASFDFNFHNYSAAFGVVMHEMIHAMAFQPNLFKYFINWTKNARYGSAGVIQEIDFTAQAPHIGKKQVCILPEVAKWATAHWKFELTGYAMNISNSNTHWLRDYLGNELMVGATVVNPIIGGITLAFLQGTGWYTPNLAMAETGVWYKGYTAQILKDVCPKNNAQCAGAGVAGCSNENRFTSTCTGAGFANNCKYQVPTNYATQDCTRERREYSTDSVWGEWRGANQRCFTGSLTTVSATKAGSFCFEPKCTVDANKNYILAIKVAKAWYTCKGNGLFVKPLGYTGTGVACPSDIQGFCKTYAGKCHKDCHGRGRCLASGKCACYSGFSGEACGEQVGKLKKKKVNGHKIYLKKSKCESWCTWHGVCLKGLGYCMCNAGKRGDRCSMKDKRFKTKGSAKVVAVSLFGLLLAALMN